MNFFSPANAFWLVPLAGGIVLLWMLRPRRVDVVVPSLFLWRAVVADTRAAHPFQKLRRSLLLLLQLVAAFLLVVALAGPFVYGNGLTGRTLIVVIDDGATMNARANGGTRLDEAKDRAARFLHDELRASDHAALVVAGRVPVLAQAPTENEGRLRDSITQIAPTDDAPDLFAALALARSLAQNKRGAEIRVFTDGGISDTDARRLAALDFGTTDVREVKIGTAPAPNIGITQMSSRRDTESSKREVFVGLQSFGGARGDGGTLSVSVNGKLADARAVSLMGGAQNETFDSLPLAQGGVVTARLDDVHDALASDNAASLVVPAPRVVKVLLVSAGNLFLEKGLNLDTDVALSECAPADFMTLGKGGAGYDVVVLDDFLPPGGVGRGQFLTFAVSGSGLPVVSGKGAPAPTSVVDRNRAHPVMRGVDLSGVSIGSTPKTALAAWAVSLADGGDAGPLIAAGEHDGRRILSVSPKLSDTDWPLRVSFPIFLGNAERWLAAGNQLGAVDESVFPGQPAQIHLPPGMVSAGVFGPGGSAKR